MTTCVVDAEVVAYDREKDCLLPFQVLSTRKRKVEDGDEDQKVKVILQAFDILYLNGKSLLQLPLLQRRNLLHSSFVHNQGDDTERGLRLCSCFCFLQDTSTLQAAPTTLKMATQLQLRFSCKRLARPCVKV